MAEPGALDYFYGTEAEQYTFYRIPKVLFTDPGFRRITADAKILYGLMLDRMGLSIRNGWLDEQERVFIYFTLEEAMDAMCCGHNKAVSLFTELDKVGLIERKKQGQGRPTKIYVKNFIRKEEVKTSENRKSALPETGTLDFRKSDTINTDKNKTDRNDTDPSIHPAAQPSEDRPPTAADTMDTIRAYREILKENIEYDILRKNLGYDCDLLDEILDILVDTVCSTRKMIRIGGEDYPKEVVKSRLLKLDSGHIEYVISSLHENTTKVRNIRAYLLTSLSGMSAGANPRQRPGGGKDQRYRQSTGTQGRKEAPKAAVPAGAAPPGAGGASPAWGQCAGKGTVIGMALLKVEQETIILFNEAETTASVYTHNAALQRVLLELCQTHPAQVRQTEDNRCGGLTFELPKKWVKISPPRALSEAQKRVLDEMNQRNRERRQSA